MSSSLLYHGFGVRGYHYERTEYRGGAMTFTISQPRESYRCPVCSSENVIGRGGRRRRFRTLPIGGKPVYLAFWVPRVECRDCGAVRRVKMGFADHRVSYTRAFERYALELSRFMTIKDVADHLQISWDVIKGIQKKDLKRRFDKPKLKHLTKLAIDEISIGKGHRYVTLVMDLESGAVVYVGDGKGADSLLPFWKRLRRSGAKIEAVATDMSLAYIDAVTTHLPEAALVFDRFHVIKLYNDKLAGLRRALHRELTDSLEKKALKGVRWLLLKRPEHLDVSRQEPDRLAKALKLNEPLAVAYYLKEELNQIWEQDDQKTAETLLLEWVAYAESTGVVMLQKFAKLLRLHAWRILAWYDYPISTGPLEGTNNKIKTMKRQAYGFRDPEFFRLKILGIHETTYALVG